MQSLFRLPPFYSSRWSLLPLDTLNLPLSQFVNAINHIYQNSDGLILRYTLSVHHGVPYISPPKQPAKLSQHLIVPIAPLSPLLRRQQGYPAHIQSNGKKGQECTIDRYL